ncbi:hypothetical protein M433DRAFT_5058 [Acidomyces richmondensis BFW]|nr:MAG: hypothetical protein FE78DRAFT_100287 [Acidomyces sp. 'richmondensis']KYG44883.1 hypothetical protein M433DRAFT_5058 [Acidomyces richmondensis BFW]
MARFQMDALVFVVMNNNGIYRGDTNSKSTWQDFQKNKMAGKTLQGAELTVWSLGHETDYHNGANMTGGKGFSVWTPHELKKAAEADYHTRCPVIVNVIMDL